jgi:hypothetical protein
VLGLVVTGYGLAEAFICAGFATGVALVGTLAVEPVLRQNVASESRAVDWRARVVGGVAAAIVLAVGVELGQRTHGLAGLGIIIVGVVAVGAAMVGRS